MCDWCKEYTAEETIREADNKGTYEAWHICRGCFEECLSQKYEHDNYE